MNTNARAIVFDIQRFSLHDGPGIRTVVFLKGCSLACVWCHNPEAINGGVEIGYLAGRCVPGCDACIAACPEHAIGRDRERRIDFSRCNACGACIDACASNCFVRIGQEVSVDEVVDAVSRDAAFYEASGGGVTLSGGEPVLQMPFLLQLLPRLRASALHVAVETAGSFSFALIEPLLAYVDLWLFDLKLMDPFRHDKFTGCGNERILANLERLVNTGAPVCVRMPVVPGINTSDENIRRTADVVRGLGLGALTLLPYNQLWEAKLPRLACDRPPLGIRPPEPEYYASLRDAFAAAGVQARLET